MTLFNTDPPEEPTRRLTRMHNFNPPPTFPLPAWLQELRDQRAQTKGPMNPAPEMLPKA
jgi:hypothetical protein